MDRTIRKVKGSLRLISLESVITATCLAMPIMAPFFNSIGMDQGQIGLSQAVFTIVILVLDVPAGWIADRFSRKWANILGDFGAALGFLFYAQVDSFAGVVAAEVILGITLSFSSGVDSILVEDYTNKIGDSFQERWARIVKWRAVAQIAILAIGAPLGAYDFRLAIAASSAVYFVGGFVSLFLLDSEEKHRPSHRNFLVDIKTVIKDGLWKNKDLRWKTIAYAVATEITHPTLWVLTPLLLLAGVPMILVASSWILNSIAEAIAAELVQKRNKKIAAWPAWQKFVLPILVVSVGFATICVHLSLITVWLYAVAGFARGWTSSVIQPMVQEGLAADVKTTLMSFAKCLCRLIYVPLVWLFGLVGNADPRWSLALCLVVFLPASFIIVRKLKR
ncbi:MFS transporter [Candidatus Saccharibacteria bacterium]|nr:MFS transporter [Candidatus Saccharibacteria bacterium]